MSSLIVQRMEIERDLFAGKGYFVLGGIFILAGVIGLVFSLSWGYIIPIVIGLVGIWRGTMVFGKGRRNLEAFEKENGEGAGVQTPIRYLDKRADS